MGAIRYGTFPGLDGVKPGSVIAAGLALIAFVAMALHSGDARADGPDSTPSPDRDALLALYHATGGANWADTHGCASARGVERRDAHDR